MHARYCEPETGKFLSVDPAIGSAKLELPQSWNRYLYGLASPLGSIDRDGRMEGAAIRQDQMIETMAADGKITPQEIDAYHEQNKANAVAALAGAGGAVLKIAAPGRADSRLVILKTLSLSPAAQRTERG